MRKGVVPPRAASFRAMQRGNRVVPTFGIALDIVPDETVQMDRSLDSSRFRAMTGFVPPSWPDMIGEMASDATPYEQWRGSREATR